MSKKLIYLVSVVMVCVVFMTSVACQQAVKESPATAASTTGAASAATSAAATASTAAPELKGKIVVWIHNYDVEAALYKEFVENFKKQNPGVTVDFQTIPYDMYWDKLNVALETNNGPDVFRVPVNVLGEYYFRKQLSPIPDDLYTNEAFESAFSPNIIQPFKMTDGKYYGIPSSIMPLILIINDKMFQDAGLDPSRDAPKTWSQFRETAKKLTVRDSKGVLKVAGASIMTSPYQYYWTFPVQNIAGGVADAAAKRPTFANEDGYAAWKFLTGLITADKVDSNDLKGAMDNSTAAMQLQEYVSFADLKKKAPNGSFSVHLPPSPDGKDQSAVFTSWAFAVSSASKASNAAWHFIDFMESPDNQKTAALKAIDLPSRTSILEDAELRKDPNLSVALDALKIAKAYNGLGWDDIWYIEQAAFESVVLKNTDVKKAVDEASKKCEELYAKKFKTK